jgi:MoaA/NifB/PqqE/SkfB family radical SAM enzyme
MNAPELRAPIVGNRVELNIFTTLTCNLKCLYCSIATGDVLGSQGKVGYSPDLLNAFIATHLAD